MYECESNDKPDIDLQLNPYEYGMFNDFELLKVHAESAKIEIWSICNT